MNKHYKHAQTMRIDLGDHIDRMTVRRTEDSADHGRSHRVAREAELLGRRARDVGGDAFNELLQNIYDGVVLTALDGNIISVNERILSFLGCKGDEVCALNIVEILVGADNELIPTLLDNLENDRFTLIQGYMICKDGGVFPAEISTNRMCIAGEHYLGFFVRDISLRKQREDQLRLGYSALENSGSGIAMTDLEGRLDYVNHALRGLWGLQDDEEVKDLSVLDFVVDEDFLGCVLEAARGGEPWRGELTMKPRGRDPIEVRASLRANANEDDEITGLVFSLMDVTEERAVQRTLKESEQRHRMLFREMLSGFAVHELIYDDESRAVDYRFLEVNPAFERMTGLMAGDVKGRTVREVLPGTEDLWIETYGRVVLTGEPEHFQRFSEELGKHFEVTAFRSGPNQFATVFEDITERLSAAQERERLQAQLRQSQKIEAIGRLAGGVAHDFNNLLMGIMGYVELSMDDLAEDHPVRAYLAEIMVDAKRSANLTRQLLAFARRQPIAPKMIEMNEIVSGMLSMLQRLLGEDIDLVWVPSSETCAVNMDSSQLDQALANLIINARDAISGVGTVTVRVEKVTVDAAQCIGHADATPGEYALLEVSDTGCGMDADTLAHVFEPFYTTKGAGKGSGLGLATVHGVVRQNKGFVAVESEVGSGSVFRLYIPRHAEGVEKQDEETSHAPLPGGTETILLVEDEKSVRETARSFLLKLGYQVLSAELPDKALRVSEKYAGEIDLLITDVIMPGMNGVDLASKLSPSRPTMKCLFISGYVDNVVVKHGLLDEGVHFLAKPFLRKDLAAKVREVLDACPAGNVEHRNGALSP